ncbi:MAG: MBL fold metallo-hydrolase [Actinobacteria bacterium]|nr:MBL fold metallo-hydrolase [Actinomycetota bacterium]
MLSVVHSEHFDPYQACIPGEPAKLFPGVTRVVAPNPGAMTGPGTNSYIIGSDELVVVDPGPELAEHVHLLADIGEGRISKIAVTHKHLDHAPAAALLARITGAETAGFTRSPGFEPDRLLTNGDILSVQGAGLRAIYTPGHSSDHLCYMLLGEDLLFTGDHLMQGSTVVIAPLDGDMARYMDSLRLLLEITPPVRALLPGHGMCMDDPARMVSSVIEHRRMREEAVWEALCRLSRTPQVTRLSMDQDGDQDGRLSRHPGESGDQDKSTNGDQQHHPNRGLQVVSGSGSKSINDGHGQGISIDDMIMTVYRDVPESLHSMARYSLWAHLRKLTQEGRVRAVDMDKMSTLWRPVCLPY